MSSRSFLGNLRRPEASLAQVLQCSTHMETNAKKGLLGRAIATAAPEAKEFRKIDRIARYR